MVVPKNPSQTTKKQQKLAGYFPRAIDEISRLKIENNTFENKKLAPHITYGRLIFTVVVRALLKSLLPNFQPQRQWCIKTLLPWAQKFYTPLVLGRGSTCPWQFFAPAVVVYKILSPNLGAHLRGHNLRGSVLLLCM